MASPCGAVMRAAASMLEVCGTSMPKMSDADLRALLAAEKADALSAMAASKLS